jgi:hypothetical protein
MQTDPAMREALPRQSVEGCAWILRIVLLARKSCPYSSAQDVRGILLDSYC